MKIYIAIFALIMLAFAPSCNKVNQGDKVPYIKLEKFGPDSVSASNLQYDSLRISFNIQDGDGDLGNDFNVTNVYDIYLRRIPDTNTQYNGLAFPDLPLDYKNPTKGVEASCSITYSGFIFTPRQDPIHLLKDTAYIEFYVKDRAGHESNHIITPPVYILP